MELKFPVRGADGVAEESSRADVHVYVVIICWVIWSLVYSHLIRPSTVGEGREWWRAFSCGMCLVGWALERRGRGEHILKQEGANPEKIMATVRNLKVFE